MKHRHQYLFYSLIATAFTLLAGCASLDNIRHTDQEVDRSVQNANQASRHLQQMKTSASSDVASVVAGQFVDLTPMPADPASQLPACNVVFTHADRMTLLATTQWISRICHVDVQVTPDVLSGLSGGSLTGQASAQGIPVPPGVSLPAMPGPSAAAESSATQGRRASLADQTVDLDYSGPLAGFLDNITGRFGLGWRVDNRQHVVIFHTETKIFHVFNLPKALDMNSVFSSGTTTTAGVQGGASGGGGGGGGGSGSGGVSGQTGSAQTTTVGLKADPAADLLASVKAMMTPGSGQVFYSQSNGTLVATDTPMVLDRVGTYIQALNATYSKQVLVNVTLLTVTVNNDDSYGLNWTAVYTDLAQNFGINLSNTYTATNGAVSGAVNILSGSSHWSGSQALVNALATQGKVRVMTEPSVVARNLTPSPIQIARQTGYIAQSSNTISSGSDGFSQSSLTPGTVTTGFNMWAMPMIYPDNKTMELSLSINLSSLIDILKKDSGDSSIEVPEIDNKMFAPDVTLRTGDTAVIATFKQDSLDNERSGTGSPHNWLFGGGTTGSRQSVYIVIAVTPVVLRDRVPPATGLAFN